MSVVSTLYALAWDLKMDWGLPLCTMGGLQACMFGSSLQTGPSSPERKNGPSVSRSSSASSVGSVGGPAGSSWLSARESGRLGGVTSPDRRAPPLGVPDAAGARRYPGYVYNLAAGTNALARLGWAVYISPGQQVVQQHTILLLGCVELMRRAQWAAIRLEWEQLTRERKKAADEAAANSAAAQAWHEHARAMQRHASF